MHLVLTGATGLVGSAVLRAMLQDQSVTQVTILSRRAVPMAEGHAKAHVVLHDDFSRYTADPKLAATLASASGAVWALGTSQNAVPADRYEQITFDYALAFARFWAGLPSDSDAAAAASSAADPSPAPAKNTENHKRTLVFVSGEGASHTPGLLTPRFGVVKGRTEMALLDLTSASAAKAAKVAKAAGDKSQHPIQGQDGDTKKTHAHDYFPNLTVWAARPGGVDPRHQADIQSYIPAVKAWKLPLMAAMSAVTPGMMSPTAPMAKVLVELAKGGMVPASEGKEKEEGKSNDLKYVRVEAPAAGAPTQGREWRGGVVRNVELRRLGGL